MTGRRPASEGACTHQQLRHPPAGRPLRVLANPFWTRALLLAMHLACATVKVHVEASHEILANHWCTRVVQNVDSDEARATLEVCLGRKVALNAANG